MTIRNLLLGLGALVLIQTTACRKPNIDAGTMTSEDRSVGAFTELVVDGSMDVFITQDTAYEVKVETGDRLMRYIESDVTNGRLNIYERNNNVIRNRTVRVYVSAAALERVELDGSGDIAGAGFASTDLHVELDGSGDVRLVIAPTTSTTVRLDGSGDIELDGSTPYLDIEAKGSGEVDGRWLESANADAFLDGSGDIKVWATQSLNATLYGSGNISYWGNPATVSTNVDGSGDIIGM